jgi:ABC-type amino acid transport system permease subunit
VTGSAYTAEIFRASIGAVDAGQDEAATALGFSRRSTFRHVVFPQALRIAVPPLGNILIGLLKGATLISVIGVADMIFVAQQINLDYFTPFEPFTAVAVILIVIVAAFSLVISLVERFLRLP